MAFVVNVDTPGLYLLLSTALMPFGATGLILANSLSMSSRIAYSLWFIRKHFQTTWNDLLAAILPKFSTVSLMAVVPMILYASYSGFKVRPCRVCIRGCETIPVGSFGPFFIRVRMSYRCRHCLPHIFRRNCLETRERVGSNWALPVWKACTAACRIACWFRQPSRDYPQKQRHGVNGF